MFGATIVVKNIKLPSRKGIKKFIAKADINIDDSNI